MMVTNTGEDAEVTLVGDADKLRAVYLIDEPHALTSAVPVQNRTFILRKNQTALIRQRLPET